MPPRRLHDSDLDSSDDSDVDMDAGASRGETGGGGSSTAAGAANANGSSSKGKERERDSAGPSKKKAKDVRLLGEEPLVYVFFARAQADRLITRVVPLGRTRMLGRPASSARGTPFRRTRMGVLKGLLRACLQGGGDRGKREHVGGDVDATRGSVTGQAD